jgi:hypothetical protein
MFPSYWNLIFRLLKEETVVCIVVMCVDFVLSPAFFSKPSGATQNKSKSKIQFGFAYDVVLTLLKVFSCAFYYLFSA